MLPGFRQFRSGSGRGIGDVGGRAEEDPPEGIHQCAVRSPDATIATLIAALAAQHLRGIGQQILLRFSAEFAFVDLRQ